MPLKEDHERAVVKRALEALSVPYTSLRRGAAGVEPDCITKVGDETWGIEHTTAYYTSGQARATWTAARDAMLKKQAAVYSSGTIDEFDVRLLNEVARLFSQKQTKKYSGIDRLILLVHMDAVLTEDDFIKKIVELMRLQNDGSQFSEAWLGRYQRDGSYRVWKI